jgi:hypothetical protein
MAQSPKADLESWGVELALTWRQVELQGLNISVATACILHQICAANDKQSAYHPRTAPFVGLEIPDIGVVDYCKRLRKYFNCSPSCFVTALMYIDTILTKTKKLSPEHRVVLDTLTIHRLTLVALVLAVKYHEDNHYSQAYYAQVGGVSLSELNAIERKFVEILEWDLDVNYDRFAKYFGELVCHPSVCKECQADVAPADQKQEQPPTPKKSPKKEAPKAKEAPKPPSPKTKEAPKAPSKSAQVKSALGKWTNSLTQSVAATRSMFSEFRAGTEDPDRSVWGKQKKTPGQRLMVDKENLTPEDTLETDDVDEQYADLTLEETNGPEPDPDPDPEPERRKSHWHDAISMQVSDMLVSAV